MASSNVKRQKAIGVALVILGWPFFAIGWLLGYAFLVLRLGWAAGYQGVYAWIKQF